MLPLAFNIFSYWTVSILKLAHVIWRNVDVERNILSRCTSLLYRSIISYIICENASGHSRQNISCAKGATKLQKEFLKVMKSNLRLSFFKNCTNEYFKHYTIWNAPYQNPRTQRYKLLYHQNMKVEKTAFLFVKLNVGYSILQKICTEMLSKTKGDTAIKM